MSNQDQPSRAPRRAIVDQQKRAAAEAAIIQVGKEIVAGTKAAEQTAIRSARAVAVFLEQRSAAAVSIDLGNGPDGALRQLHKALGSALQTQDDIIAARLTLFGITRHLGFAYGEMCPCSEGPQPQRTSGELRAHLSVVDESSAQAA